MDFKTLFRILKKHLSDGMTTPEFFRELMAIITDVPEEEWGTSKDPSQKGRDNTITGYTKRKLPVKMAQTIVYRLNTDRLASNIEEKEETQRRLLAADFTGYDSSVNADNVGQKVADWLEDIIQQSAGLVDQSALEKQKQAQADQDLKEKYGDYLLAEEENRCPFPGCGKELSVAANGNNKYVYEVTQIDKELPATPENLLATCPRCHALYLMDSNKKLCKTLKQTKKVLSTHRQSVHLLDDLPLEKGIINVITKISKLKEKDLADASMDPKEIRQKIDPEKDLAIYLTVTNYVSAYFIRIKDIMMNLDKRNEIDYEEIQDQMHALYRKLKKAKKSKLEIFNEITDKVHHVSMQDNLYCQIVVAYFVQSCEVFDAITE